VRQALAIRRRICAKLAPSGARRMYYEVGFLIASALILGMGSRLLRRPGPYSKFAHALLICSVALAWYSVSTTLARFSNYFLASWKTAGHVAPFVYTMSHMFLTGVLSLGLMLMLRYELPRKTSPRVLLAASLAGLLTGFDVALSNFILLHVSFSRYTMLKSARIILILVFGVSLGMERCSLLAVGGVVAIVGGIMIASFSEAEFGLLGVSLVMGSEVCASMRWLLAQMIIRQGSLDTMSTLLCMSPASTLALLPAVLAHELNEVSLLGGFAAAADFNLLMLLPGVLVFLLIFIEVWLVKVSSALTLSVFGSIKIIVAMFFSILVYGEGVSRLQLYGLLVALAGLVGYWCSGVRSYSIVSAKYGSVPQEAERRLEASLATVYGRPSNDADEVSAMPVSGTSKPRYRHARRPPALAELDSNEAHTSCGPHDLMAPTSPVVFAARQITLELAEIERTVAQQLSLAYRAQSLGVCRPQAQSSQQAKHMGSSKLISSRPDPGSPAAAQRLNAARARLSAAVKQATATLAATSGSHSRSTTPSTSPKNPTSPMHLLDGSHDSQP